MRSFILFLFVLGVIFIAIGYTESYKNCPLPKIEYRYVPRSFYEEQVSGSNLTQLYSDMFNERDMWSTYPLGFIENNASLSQKQLKNFISSSSSSTL